MQSNSNRSLAEAFQEGKRLFPGVQVGLRDDKKSVGSVSTKTSAYQLGDLEQIF